MDEATRAYYDLINAQQQANNEWSAKQAQKAMDYQTEMSNTAHQREVRDLVAAGLNPVLSAGGSGATTGSGIAASAGDGNVTALYGLAKQAIEANMKQAEAMANQAKSVSEVAASSSGSGKGPSKGSTSGSDIEDIDYPWYVTALGEYLKRKFGISLETYYKGYEAVVDLATDGNRANVSPADLKQKFDVWWSRMRATTSKEGLVGDKVYNALLSAYYTVQDYRAAHDPRVVPAANRVTTGVKRVFERKKTNNNQSNSRRGNSSPKYRPTQTKN